MKLTLRAPSLETTQKIVKTIVGFTTARVVKTVIYNNTPNPETLTKAQNAQVWIGSAAIAMTVADRVEAYTDKFVADFYAAGSEIKTQIDADKANTES